MKSTALAARFLRHGARDIQLLSTTLVLMVILLLSEVPLEYCILSTLLVMSHTFVGAKIYQRFVPSDATNFPLGVGFAIGSLLAVALDQLLVPTAFRDFSWIAIPIAAFIALIRDLQTSRPFHTPSTAQISITTLGFLVLTGLVQERYWPLWIAISMLPLVLIGNTKIPKVNRTYIITLWALVVGTALLGGLRLKTFSFLSLFRIHWLTGVRVIRFLRRAIQFSTIGFPLHGQE